MSLTSWFVQRWQKHSRFHYHLEVVNAICYLTLHGDWEMDHAPLVMEKAIAKLLKQDWVSLRVDCRRVRPGDRRVLDTAFVATMIRLARLATEQAVGKGVEPDWRFRFRMREQTKVLEMAKLEKAFEGHIFYERNPFGFNSRIVLRSPSGWLNRSETGNTT